MGGGQPGGGLHADAEDFDQRQRSSVVQPALQGRPADVGHDEIGQPGRFGHAVDFDHVVVDHRGSRLGLAGETLSCRSAAAQVRGQDLDRHVPVQGGVEGLQHDAHSARADDAHDFIRPPAAEHPIIVRGRQQLQHRGLAGRSILAGRIGVAGTQAVRRQLFVAQGLAEFSPDVFAGGGRFQPLTAIATGTQVRLEGRLLLVAQFLFQEQLDPFRITGGSMVVHLASPARTRPLSSGFAA